MSDNDTRMDDLTEARTLAFNALGTLLLVLAIALVLLIPPVVWMTWSAAF